MARSRSSGAREGYSPASTRSRISVPVGALASKSRCTTASSCSSVSRTEKSSSAVKLEGKTRRPWPLTTKGLIAHSPALHVHPAVDGPHLPRDVGGGVGAEEVHDPGDLVRAAEARERDLLLDAF